MFSTVYNSLLTQPMLNALIALYNYLGKDMGIAIVVLTVIIRLILYPSFKHQLESQRKLAVMQPKIQELKEKYKNNPEQQSKAMMEFYKENKINPLSSCLPLVIQLVILIALFQVFQSGLNGSTLNNLYPFVSRPDHINTIAFGFLNLAAPSIALAAITGIFQFFQSKQMMSQQKPAKTPGVPDMTGIMLYLLPAMTVIFGMRLPAGLTIYWLVTTLFAIGQQYLIMRNNQRTATNAAA